MASIVSTTVVAARLLAPAAILSDSKAVFGSSGRMMRPRMAPLRSRAVGSRQIVMMTKDVEDIKVKVTEAIKEATEICEGAAGSGECAAAWDDVEELSAALSHKKVANAANPEDALDKFCKDSPEADECRVYED